MPNPNTSHPEIQAGTPPTPGTPAGPAIPGPAPQTASPSSALGESASLLGPLLETLAAALAPFFQDATAGDIALARAIAREVLTETPPRSALQLLLTAQFVAFSLAAVGILGQCIQQDARPETAAGLHANAEKLGRAADRAHRALLRFHRQMPEPGAEPAIPPVPRRGPFRTQPRTNPVAPAATQSHPAPTGSAPTAADWGDVFANLANEFAEALPTLPPEARRIASLRAAALNSTASTLIGQKPPLAR